MEVNPEPLKNSIRVKGASPNPTSGSDEDGGATLSR
jgi:hypothetical protein